MKKIADGVRALSPAERRRFLQVLGAVLAAPFVPAATRYAARELAVSEAYAQELETATLFLEFNFRDQVDLMHVMVPPSIVRYPNRSVGVNGAELSMFAPQSELKEYPNNVFLTNDSLELAPHVDSIAMLDTGEPGIGNVHGHEAGNGMRSPGRVMDGGASGKQPMYLIDAPTEGSNGAGSEKLFSRSPTPASFHNYYQKQLTTDLSNGFAFKGISRFKHSVYHFGAGLPGAELTRLKTRTELFAIYDAVFMGFVPPPEQNQLVQDILGHVGLPYRKASGPGYEALKERFHLLDARHVTGLELTPEEATRWREGVPSQKCTSGCLSVYDCGEDPNVDPNSDGFVKAQIWEQFAYASKLFRAGGVNSIALEFDHMDLTGNGSRPENVQRTYAQQVARPLARLITDLKAAGLYERTLIAVYTLDGSRKPDAESYGNDGKGTVLLAGGRVRGGYYGDILITSDLPTRGHTYAFRPPDPATGELLPAVSNWSDLAARTPSGAVWRTVVKAMGIPEAEYVGKFDPLIDDAVAMDFMLKS